MARPRKADADRKTEVFAVRATKGEVDAACRLARRRGCTLAELLQACLRHIREDEAPSGVSVVQKPRVRLNPRILASVVLH